MDLERRDNMLKKNRTIIAFILGVLTIVYIGTINDIKYQNQLNEDTYAYEYVMESTMS